MSPTTTAVRSIEDTIREVLTANGHEAYLRFADPVIGALTTREMNLGEKLVDYAIDAGADSTEVRAYLSEIGMAVAEPDPWVVDEDDEEDADDEAGEAQIAAALDRIERRLDNLTDFARRNGYRG